MGQDAQVINRVPNRVIWSAAELVFSAGTSDGREMALAVVDESGGLVFGAQSDRCHPRVLRVAMRKAYTAAVMRRDTVTFRDEDRAAGKDLADWGDPMFTHLVGGVLLRAGADYYGGVGVGGNTTERDETIATLVAATLLEGLSRGAP